MRSSFLKGPETKRRPRAHHFTHRTKMQLSRPPSLSICSVSDRKVITEKLAKQNSDAAKVREKGYAQENLKRIWRSTTSPPPLTKLSSDHEFSSKETDTSNAALCASKVRNGDLTSKPARLHTAGSGLASPPETPGKECSRPVVSIRLPVISSACGSSEVPRVVQTLATPSPLSPPVSPLRQRSLSLSSLPRTTAAIHSPACRPQPLFHLAAPQSQNVSTSWMMHRGVHSWPVGSYSAVPLLTPVPRLFQPGFVSHIPMTVGYRPRRFSPPAPPESPETGSPSSTSDTMDAPSTSACSPRSLREFAQYFKERRTRLGYTQTDVGLELRGIYGLEFSQATICRFESLQLSYDNLCRWKGILEGWLRVAEERGPDWQSDRAVLRRRRRRTTLGPAEKAVLERHYSEDDAPGSEHMEQIARELGLDRRVVRTWFCNQRQKVKRLQVFGQLAVDSASEKQPSRSAIITA